MHDLDGDGQRNLIGQHSTSQIQFEDYNDKPITFQCETLWNAEADESRSRLYGVSMFRTETSGGERLVQRLVRSWRKTCTDQPNKCSSGQGVHASCFFMSSRQGSAEAPHSGSDRFRPMDLRLRQMVSASSCGTCLRSFSRGGLNWALPSHCP